MGVIRTVRGDIAPDALGVTYPHEHLITHPPANVPEIDFRMDDAAAALRELGWFRAAGGNAIVEMSPRDYGRDAPALRRLSEQTGVHIICVSGRVKEKFSGALTTGYSVEQLADEMIRDIQVGIGDTGVRAGVIKAGSSLNTITPGEERVFRAAARAHHATGAPISTHTEAGTMGLEQVALLRAEGVPPERIIIGHMDRRMDWEYHRALLDTGVTISYDQLSKEKYYPDSLRVEYILRIFREGYGDRIMISGDMARRSYWPSYGAWGGPGLTYVLWRFVPWLRESGLADDAIEQLLIHNPARALQFR
jgi:phosphotriesterase-related protein